MRSNFEVANQNIADLARRQRGDYQGGFADHWVVVEEEVAIAGGGLSILIYGDDDRLRPLEPFSDILLPAQT